MATTRVTCPLDCPDACGLLVESSLKGEFVRLRGNPEHSYSHGGLCAKTSLFGEVQNCAERLTTPLLRNAAGDLCAASWEEATRHIADRMRGLRGEEILGLDYGGNMGKVARKFPARLMNALGAARNDSGICDQSSTVGYESVLGRVIGADLERIEEADFLLIWGADVARTVQHLQPAIQRMCKRGTPVVAIDIYRTDTIRRLEKWGGQGLVIKAGTDAALALGLARIALEEGWSNDEFLADECVGVERFKEHVLAGHDLEWVAEACGIRVEEVLALAKQLREATIPFVKSGIGWTRRRNGALGMRALCSLVAVLGRVDRFHYESYEHFQLDTDLIERPDLRTNSLAPLSHVGLGAQLAEGEFGAVFIWNHNPVVTLPDSERVRQGLARADTLVVVHDLFLTETAEVADVVLPAASFLEQNDVYSSYGHRVLQFSRAACAAPGEARGNLAAFAAIAKELELPADLWDVTDEQLCLELLESQRALLSAADFDELLRGRPVKLPPRELEGWGTVTGKIELANDLLDPPIACFVADEVATTNAPEKGAYALISAPSRATHNSTYMHSQRHLAKAGVPRCFVNQQDAQELVVQEGDLLQLSNERGAITLAVTLTEDVPRGSIRVDGLVRAQDVPERVGINALVSPVTSVMAHGSTLYSTRVDARPAPRQGG